MGFVHQILFTILDVCTELQQQFLRNRTKFESCKLSGLKVFIKSRSEKIERKLLESFEIREVRVFRRGK